MPGVEPLALSKKTIAAIVVIAAVLWSIAFFLWGQGEVDKWFLVSHNGLRTNELVVGAAQLATEYGMAIIVLVYLLCFWFAFRHEEQRDAYRIYPLVLLTFALAGIGGDVLKEILNRPRPFVEYDGVIHALSNATTPAFPSGHATKSVALILPFLLLIAEKDVWHRWVNALLVFLAISVCYSRVVLGAHYVSDVLAGIGMALISLPPAILMSNKILSRMSVESLNRKIKVWVAVLLGLMIFLIVN